MSGPRVLAILPSLIASCQIGVLKPLKSLAARGEIELRWRLESNASLSDVHWADVVTFCRNTEPAYAHLLNEALSTSKPVIYDLDDNFWDIPFETDPELARYHRLPPRLRQMERYLEQATLVRVYSPVLRDKVRKFNSNVRLLKAGFDFGLVSRRHKMRKESGKVRIVYATSRIVDDQYHEFLDGVLGILEDFDGEVEFTVWGCQPPELAGRRGVNLVPLLSDYDRFLKKFNAEGFDIGLAPLPDTPFHLSKTNTKFRDYGACGVAGVYSDVAVYSDCIEHVRTGVLVHNDSRSWYDGVKVLVENQQLRNSISKAAYDEVYTSYRQELMEEEWLAEVRDLLVRSTGYAATSGLNLSRKLRIRADFPELCGIKFPRLSPDREPAANLLMEISTPEGNLVREASATICARKDEETVRFFFEPIVNSKDQEFIVRFIKVPDDAGAPSESWIPTAAFLHMIYGGGSCQSLRSPIASGKMRQSSSNQGVL